MNMGKIFILKYWPSLVGTKMSASSHKTLLNIYKVNVDIHLFEARMWVLVHRRHCLVYKKLIFTFTSLKFVNCNDTFINLLVEIC